MSKPQKLKNRTHLQDHFIYYNLHKRCWSLKALRTVEPDAGGLFAPSVKGRVTGHADTVLATVTTCKVSEAGRLRVIREKSKNIHAGIVGKSCIANPSNKIITTDTTPSLTYNPYKRPDFYDRETGETVTTARHVLLRSGCDDSPPRVHYGDDLYYAYWADDDGNIDSVNITGFLNRGDLYTFIGHTHFTGFVRRVSCPLKTYLKCRDGHATFAD
jgi:hypothetical protein